MLGFGGSASAAGDDIDRWFGGLLKCSKNFEKVVGGVLLELIVTVIWRLICGVKDSDTVRWVYFWICVSRSRSKTSVSVAVLYQAFRTQALKLSNLMNSPLPRK